MELGIGWWDGGCVWVCGCGCGCGCGWVGGVGGGEGRCVACFGCASMCPARGLGGTNICCPMGVQGINICEAITWRIRQQPGGGRCMQRLQPCSAFHSNSRNRTKSNADWPDQSPFLGAFIVRTRWQAGGMRTVECSMQGGWQGGYLRFPDSLESPRNPSQPMHSPSG
jgi:hypothetical protein